MITCIIISYNEERRIRLVIAAAKRWADEVVLADKSSTDETPNIARQLGVYVHKLPYSEQGTEDGRDVVASARFDWILAITAGEIPTPNLIANIRRILRSKSDSLDLIVVPLKYWSFGTHDEKSPWGWSKQPRVFHRRRITYLNQVHNHITASPDRTIDLSHHRHTAHILHQTHPNSRQFMRSHWEYMRAEAEADPNVRLANALGQINRYDANFDQISNKTQLHAWKLYWHGVALHCLEKIQGRNIESEYSWRREKYYKLWDSLHLECEDQPVILSELASSEFFPVNLSDNIELKFDSRWIIDSNRIENPDPAESLKLRDIKPTKASAFLTLFDDPFSLDICKSLFKWNWEGGRFGESVVWVERILRIEPQNLNWINRLIIAYAKSNQRSKSIELAEKSLRQYGRVFVFEKNLDIVTRRVEGKMHKIDIPVPSLCKNKPKVSAIVSVYNSSKFLEQCLINLCSQTLFLTGELEIVVVNTGSQEEEGAIVKRFVENGYQIKYIEVTTRETVYSAWNRGIQASSGIYVTSANADDRHQVNALQLMAEALDAHSNVALVYADVDITEEENCLYGEAFIVGQYKWSDFCPIQLLKGCFCGPQPMWRKDIHEKIGYFDADFVSAGDYEMWLRMAVDYKFLHLKQVLGLYLKSPLSLEHSNSEKGIVEANVARSRYQDKILSKHYPATV
jgi:glycosyltransferase involved in cell wall biosynthesis